MAESAKVRVSLASQDGLKVLAALSKNEYPSDLTIQGANDDVAYLPIRVDGQTTENTLVLKADGSWAIEAVLEI